MEENGKVDLEIKGRIAEIIIDHPPANTLNQHTLSSLGNALQILNCSESVNIIIISGKGDKFFAGGADIKEFGPLNQETGRIWIQFWHEVFRKIHYSPKIVIAAINGFALGGGCELALACDLRVASETAKLGQPEVNYGIIPAGGGTQRLPRIAGLTWAKELIFTGDIISAQEAYRMGIVNRVVPLDKLKEEVQKLAEKLLSKGPIALRLAKEAIHAAMELPLEIGLKREIELFTIACGTEDKNEGAKAFFEKRPPQFKGK
ncbi:MAG: enoyl-CoA hydratase-related protein [Candidatus Anstonellales archaeon]